MRVLVTNDDGVDAAGLHALAAAIAGDGHDVVVAAPLEDHSGYGAAIGPLHLSGRVRFQRVEVPGLEGIDVFGIEGPPALCVLTACLGGLGPRPDLVASGINAGANTGRAVLHSGTVGAALTGNNFGVPGLAVSQSVGDEHHWDTAAAVGASLVEIASSMPRSITLNVNVPNMAPGPLTAHVATLDSGGEVQTAMIEAGDGVLQLQVHERAPVPGTDSAIVAGGAIAITAIAGVGPAAIDVVAATRAVEAATRSGLTAA